MEIPSRSNRSWWWNHVEIDGDQFKCTCVNCTYTFTRDLCSNPSSTGGKHFLKKHSDKNPALQTAKKLQKINECSKNFKNLKTDPKSKKSVIENRKPYDQLTKGYEGYCLLLQAIAQARVSYNSFDGPLGDFATTTLRQTNLGEYGIDKRPASEKQDSFPAINAAFLKKLNYSAFKNMYPTTSIWSFLDIFRINLSQKIAEHKSLNAL